MEKCKFCDSVDESVLDGICARCEPMWMNEVSRAASGASPGLPIGRVFANASRRLKSIMLARNHQTVTRPTSDM